MSRAMLLTLHDGTPGNDGPNSATLDADRGDLPKDDRLTDNVHNLDGLPVISKESLGESNQAWSAKQAACLKRVQDTVINVKNAT